MHSKRWIRSMMLAGGVTAIAVAAAGGAVSTTATVTPGDLAAALHPSGLTIDAVIIKNGVPGQFGTYVDFSEAPVSIRGGVVISSGNVAQLGPLAEAQSPDYDPASPPPAVNSQMNTDIDGNTSEFDHFGNSSGNIENFTGSFDVAAMEVHFTLPSPSAVKFDFIFGSVEYPAWTSQFTDAFLVFVDGTQPTDQVTFDNNGNAVQVGSSFAGLTTTADVNTAFANPHGLIHHLTTTTPVLEEGEHVIIFEVGDVNDHILDSAAFITNLRSGAGVPGTEPSDDCRADFNYSDIVSVQDLFDYLAAFFDGESDADFNENGVLTVQDFFDFLEAFFAGCST